MNLQQNTLKETGIDDSKKTKFITKETITRLLGDVKHIIRNPLTENGIYYIHDDEDMLKGYAMIVGPEGTPYFGGNYFFEFTFPSDYPYSPPKVIYKTNDGVVRFNPNLYVNGKVCVSTLNTWRGDQWSSCQTISSILLTLCTLLCNNPLLNEPGISEKHPDYHSYTKIIEFANIDVAVCNIVNKKKGIYPEKFDMFYPHVKENFVKNHKKIVAFIEKLENNEITMIESTVYRFKTIIDYKKLLVKMRKTITDCNILVEDAPKDANEEKMVSGCTI